MSSRPPLDSSEVYDFLICGTGLTSCALSAGLAQLEIDSSKLQEEVEQGSSSSQRRLKILHVDKNPFYGEAEASLTIKEMCREKRMLWRTKEGFGWTKGGGLEESATCGTSEFQVLDCEDLSKFEEESTLRCSMSKFLLDIKPMLLPARGKGTEFILLTGTSKYLEFQKVESSWLAVEKEASDMCSTFDMVSVPFSKSSVFQDKKLSLLEKRKLMKFLTSNGGLSRALVSAAVIGGDAQPRVKLDEPERSGGDADEESWEVFLSSCFSEPKLRDALNYPVCLSEGRKDHSSWTKTAGLARVQSFLSSLTAFSEGRDGVGSSPFLSCMFGSGDVCQAFARKAAVNHAVFKLDCAVSKGELQQKASDASESLFKFTTETGEEILCRNAIFSGCAAKTLQLDKSIVGKASFPEKGESLTRVSRFVGVYRADKGREQESVSLTCIPRLEEGRTDSDEVVYCLRLGSRSGCCPQGYLVLHLSWKSGSGQGDEAELWRLASSLIPSSALLGFASWIEEETSEREGSKRCGIFEQSAGKVVVLPSGLHSSIVNMDSHFEEARKVFKTFYPDRPFFEDN